MVDVDIERFTEAVLAVCEVEIDLTELIQNIKINDDGSIESMGSGIHVLLSPDYEIEMMGGGISKEASDMIMNDEEECDI